MLMLNIINRYSINFNIMEKLIFLNKSVYKIKHILWIHYTQTGVFQTFIFVNYEDFYLQLMKR